MNDNVLSYLKIKKLKIKMKINEVIRPFTQRFIKFAEDYDIRRRYELYKRNRLTAPLMLVFAFSVLTLVVHFDKSSYTTKGYTGPNIISTVKNPNDRNNLFAINPELEIFQQIMRHSNLEPTLAMELAGIIYSESLKHKIDPFLILSVIQVESEFSPKAVSRKGARGLMQVMPRTGRYVAKKFDVPFKGYRSLFDPITNVKLGISYLAYLEELYGNMEYALFAYNHGPWKTKKIEKRFNRSTPYYVKEVLNFRDFLEKERSLGEG